VKALHANIVEIVEERKLVRSMAGKGSNVLGANGLLPKSERAIAGENTTVMP
jgi:hypothetical protein